MLIFKFVERLQSILKWQCRSKQNPVRVLQRTSLVFIEPAAPQPDDIDTTHARRISVSDKKR